MQVEFWYDFASTYSYPAAWRIDRAAAHRGVKVVWRPFMLGPLLRRQQGLSDSPFNLVAAKGRYMWRDMERICRRELLPFKRPGVFPRRSLLAARLALAGAKPGWIAAFSRSVFAVNFGEDRDISDERVLIDLVRRAGGDPLTALAAAASEDVKSALRANGEDAERKGLFGAPSFVVLDPVGGPMELFWGNDRLEDAVAFAAEHGR